MHWDVTWGNARSIRARLLILAWMLMLLALLLPIQKKTNPADWLYFPWPMVILVYNSFLGPFQGHFSLLVISIPAALFVCTPLACTAEAGLRRLWWHYAVFLGLLLPSIFPLSAIFFLQGSDRSFWSYNNLGIGYHLFCISAALAFIAVQIAPRQRPKAHHKHGFPVLPSSGDQGQDLGEKASPPLVVVPESDRDAPG